MNTPNGHTDYFDQAFKITLTVRDYLATQKKVRMMLLHTKRVAHDKGVIMYYKLGVNSQATSSFQLPPSNC